MLLIACANLECDIYREKNLRLDGPNGGAVRWRKLKQCERDDYSRRAELENEEKSKEKQAKDEAIASYPHKGPMGSTDPYGFL